MVTGVMYILELGSQGATGGSWVRSMNNERLHGENGQGGSQFQGQGGSKVPTPSSPSRATHSSEPDQTSRFPSQPRSPEKQCLVVLVTSTRVQSDSEHVL